MLAAARMFKDHAEVNVHSNQEAAPAIVKSVQESKKSFPDLSCNEFPVVNGESN